MKLILEVNFDSEWEEEYSDVVNELLLEDSGILDSLKNGVSIKIIETQGEKIYSNPINDLIAEGSEIVSNIKREHIDRVVENVMLPIEEYCNNCINNRRLTETEGEMLNELIAIKVNKYINDWGIVCYIHEDGVKIPLKEFEQIDIRDKSVKAFSEVETLLFHYLTFDEIEVGVPEDTEPFSFVELIDILNRNI